MGWCLIIPADSLSFTLSYILDLLPAVSAESFWHVVLWESTGLLEAVKHVSLNRGGNSQLPDSSMKTPCKLSPELKVSRSHRLTVQSQNHRIFSVWFICALTIKCVFRSAPGGLEEGKPLLQEAPLPLEHPETSTCRDGSRWYRVTNSLTDCTAFTSWNWHDVVKTNRRTYTFRVCPSDLQDLYVRILIVSMSALVGKEGGTDRRVGHSVFFSCC